MDKEKILRIGAEIKKNESYYDFHGKAAEIKNLISSFCGKGNPFYEAIDKVRITAHSPNEQLNSIISGFLRSVENDIISNVSYERKLKIEVVNDYLEQAENLLEKHEFHPAVAAFLIGSSLEEFLRNWILEENLFVEGQKQSIDAYATVLKRENLIDKQDHKEIISWAGIRNNAAHGKWELVNDREKISVMLAGVNIFIRKYPL